MATKPIALRSSRHLAKVRAAVKAIADEAVAAAEAIADFAEPPLREFKSADRLEKWLAAEGFRCERRIDLMPTAFKAARGRGRPVIAILAEYDALPDCGPRPGQWGHGCGHNLLGTAAAAAGIAAARVLDALGVEGQVVVWGCPAEEALHGKVYMAEQGAFRGLDAVLCWHPGAANRVRPAGGAAMDSLRLTFHGKTAHAAGGPQHGRSALDAAVLTDVAVNYLREHVEENARIHCVITRGGNAPNVVPDEAELWYYVRGRDRAQVDDLRRRVVLCAKGAALATETKVAVCVETAIAERIPNEPLAEMLDAVLHRLGPPKFTPAEQRQAKASASGKPYRTDIKPPDAAAGRASSDEDNVSWFAPLTCLNTACVPEDTVGHHRDYAAAVRMNGAHRGMLKAAEVLAAAAVELAMNAPLRRRAAEAFKKNRKGKVYKLPLSPNAKPSVYKASETA